MNPINEFSFKINPREKTKRLSSTLSISNSILFSNAKYFSGVEFGIISLLLLYEKTHAEKESYSNNRYTVKKIASSLDITEDGVRKSLKKLINKNVLIINNGIAVLNFDNLNIPKTKDITINAPEFNTTSTASVEFTEPSNSAILQPIKPIKSIIPPVVNNVIKQAYIAPEPAKQVINNPRPEPQIKSKYYDDGVTPVQPTEQVKVIPTPAPVQPKPVVLIDSGIKTHQSKYIFQGQNITNLINAYNYFISLNKENKEMTLEQFEVIYIGSWLESDRTYVPRFDTTQLVKELNNKFFYDKIQYSRIKNISDNVMNYFKVIKNYRKELEKFQLVA